MTHREPPLRRRRLLAAAAVMSCCSSGCPQEQTDGAVSWAPVNVTTAAPASTTSMPAADGGTVGSAGTTSLVSTASSPAQSGDAGAEEFSQVSGPGFEGFIMRPVGAAMWRPSKSEIHELEAETPAALRRAIDDGQIPEDVDLQGYVRQYRGDLRQKKKLIRIDYYCESHKDLAAKHSAVSGGGSCVVHASYDPQSRQLLRWWSGSPR